jgi:hypothetical protein
LVEHHDDIPAVRQGLGGVLEIEFGERLGQESDALMDRAARNDGIDRFSSDDFRRDRRPTQALGYGVGREQAMELALRVGQRRSDGMQTIEPGVR